MILEGGKKADHLGTWGQERHSLSSVSFPSASHISRWDWNGPQPGRANVHKQTQPPESCPSLAKGPLEAQSSRTENF